MTKDFPIKRLDVDFNQFQAVDIAGDYMDLLSRKLREAVTAGDQATADKLMQELTDARQRWLDAQCAIFGAKPNG